MRCNDVQWMLRPLEQPWPQLFRRALAAAQLVASKPRTVLMLFTLTASPNNYRLCIRLLLNVCDVGIFSAAWTASLNPMEDVVRREGTSFWSLVMTQPEETAHRLRWGVYRSHIFGLDCSDSMSGARFSQSGRQSATESQHACSVKILWLASFRIVFKDISRPRAT